MNSTKIEWCDFTWNPITGCLHGCECCYARDIAKRFYDVWKNAAHEILPVRPAHTAEFGPILWPDRLGGPAARKKPARIFVVSMGDLFGEWVPDEWIERVFATCEATPQHTYLFLTKSIERYFKITHSDRETMPIIEDHSNWWFGFSASKQASYSIRADNLPASLNNHFVSLEPLSGQITLDPFLLKWVIVGSETRNGRPVNVPKREWVKDIRLQCADLGIPLFEKNSLHELMSGELIQQFPEGL